jgi:mono/diheme cytochrome c family protein
VGVPTEARANPADTAYTPRPEWYFLFLFQLLKYFPGKLEVIGVIVIPTLLILLLVALPFIDRNPKRHFFNRPVASFSALAVVAGIAALTVLAVREAPPPQAAVVVDQAANLYIKNCSNCHGSSIAVPPGTDLHHLIAGGKHEGMPAWGGDLSADEIDALAGFILSPKGSAIYTQQCGSCHQQMVSAVGNPLELQRVLEEGPDYPPHQGQQVPNWKDTLSSAESNALLNFLAAPDGQRLFAINCSGCHGLGISFSGTESQLRDLISKGGQHLSMPAWRQTLTQSELDALAAYVVDTAATPQGKTLFDQHCSACHGEKVPQAPDVESARKIISSGGPHISMPVWGNVLTPEQLDALVKYALASTKGTDSEMGGRLFADNCSACHGQYGQGGPNPGRPDESIVSISSSDFLKTRDDSTIRSIIEQGQPTSGMSPFGSAYGGSMDDTQLDALVAFIRGWETNPPPEAPTKTPAATLPAITQTPTAETGGMATPGAIPSFSGQILPILQTNCSVCHNQQTKLGGWDASTYSAVMTGGDAGPAVIANDATNSLLAKKLLGAQGSIMPPSGKLPPDVIQLILDWINAGAPDN